MVGIMPPSPQKIWRFSSAHFSGKEFQKQTICGTISSKLYRQESTIGKEQNTNQTQVSQTCISKTRVLLLGLCVIVLFGLVGYIEKRSVSSRAWKK